MPRITTKTLALAEAAAAARALANAVSYHDKYPVVTRAWAVLAPVKNIGRGRGTFERGVVMRAVHSRWAPALFMVKAEAKKLAGSLNGAHGGHWSMRRRHRRYCVVRVDLAYSGPVR